MTTNISEYGRRKAISGMLFAVALVYIHGSFVSWTPLLTAVMGAMIMGASFALWPGMLTPTKARDP